MWRIKGRTIKANCDTCSNEKSIKCSIFGEFNNQAMIKKLKESGWNILGSKSFCSNCLQRVKD